VTLPLTGPQDTIELGGGVGIPRLGLGVFRAAADGETTAAVRSTCAPSTSD
jgi:hypothetical protein